MKLIVSEFVTLDGVMEAPGGEPTHRHSGWVGPYFGDEIGTYKFNEVTAAEAHLLGRVTYESFAGAWPQREGEFADKVNAMPKYVVSTTLNELGWNNCTLIGGNVVEEIQKLRERGGGPLLVAGSHTLVHTLIENGMVDELRLMIFPVAIGGGLRVFPETEAKTSLKLASSEVLDGVVLANSYVPA